MVALSLDDYDVNVYFREMTDPVSGDSFLDDCFTIHVYEYHRVGDIATSDETPFKLRLTVAETAQVLAENPVDEHGTDWWESASGFYETAPARVRAFLDGLPVVLVGGELVG